MSFFRLEAGDALPPELARDMPEILCVPPEALQAPLSDHRPNGSVLKASLSGTPINPVLINGTRLNGAPAASISLVTSADGDVPRASFDIAGTIDSILLEQYHSGLEPTAEMRLPFNYSLLPPWVKGVARSLRKGELGREPEIAFPSGDPAFVVDWLGELADWTNSPRSPRTKRIEWPHGHRAAVTISHDVDTDWVFRNPEWLERIVDVEAEHGLYGAWFCVPAYSQSRASARGIERLIERGCEVGCHGYNHDAKWPLLNGRKFAQRVEVVKKFRDRWGLRGCRSEWLWRTPAFLSVVGELFEYDSSVPTVSPQFTSHSRNGCGTCFPYVTYGGLMELPLTVPMDEARHLGGLGLEDFWRRQVERASQIIERGGMVMLSLHPQPHQAANSATLAAVGRALKEIVSMPNLWLARPQEIAAWAGKSLTSAEPRRVPLS
jgi:peptidoglycan/xylan/chitin deacetylase (PgdA/CDA1 family)